MWEITVSALPDQIEMVTEFVNEQLLAAGCLEEARLDVDVAVDELFGNIVQYAYGAQTGTATVRVELEEDPLRVVITFIDRGVPFNPLTAKQPDIISLPAKNRPIGGLGLFMVRKIMDDISYRYEDGMNILTVWKALQG